MFSAWNVEVLVRIKKSKKGMNKLSLFTLVIGMFISLGGEAQNLNEIGIGLTTDSDHRLFLNYKLALKEKRSINFRLSQGWDIRESLWDRRFYQSTSTSEIYFEESNLTQRDLQTRLTIGPEFQIGESNFSWAVEGILGYLAQSEKVRENTYEASYNNASPHNMSYLHPPVKSEITIDNKREYLVTGVQGRISLKAMATERLGIKLFGEIGMDYIIELTDIQKYPKEAEPVPEPNENVVHFEMPRDYLIPQFRIGATIYFAH